jgi:predicted DNA-binding transcriptional regulator YafY
LLLLLQARGRMTAQALAQELEVSVRTVYRDVEALLAAGVPLYAEAGHAGGYQLVQGYSTRLTGLNSTEAQALFLAALPGPAAELGLSAVLTAAQLKVRAALPAQLRAQAGRIQERFHLDAPGWYDPVDEIEHLPAVADAVWNRRTVCIRYSRWRAPTEVERRVEPHGLVLKAGRWYTVARCAGTLRTYRVDQILAIEDLGEQFEPEPGFDLAAHWRAYLSDFQTRLREGAAVVRVSPYALDAVRTRLAVSVARAVAENGRVEDDGWTRATVPIESVEHAHAEFLQLGAGVEVLEPAQLRERLAESVRSLAALYDVMGTQPDSPG